MGDFNYRIDLPPEEVRRLARQNQLGKLLQYDQLNSEKAAKRIFKEFSEMPITFRPTYKYDNGTDVYDTSEKARIPSWTDRILYKGDELTMLNYERKELMQSDHRPVRALLSIEAREIDKCKMEKIMTDAYNSCLKMATKNPTSTLIDFSESTRDSVPLSTMNYRVKSPIHQDLMSLCLQESKKSDDAPPIPPRPSQRG